MQWLGRMARFWVPVLVVCLSLFLAYNNRSLVHLNLSPWVENLELPGYLMFMAFFLAGAGTMGLHSVFDSVRKGLTIRRLTKRLRELDPDFEDGAKSRAQAAPLGRAYPPMEPLP